MGDYKKTIKLAAVHCAYLDLPENAKSYSKSFNEEAAYQYVQDNIKHTVKWLNTAGEKGADLVSTNEDFAAASTYGRDILHPTLFKEISRKIQPEIEILMAATAKKHGMYITANFIVFEGETMYNATSLFDREGKIKGLYKKTHPANGERWHIKKGNAFPVFETDIGKIGISICYDINFPEVYRCLALNGADIIVHQTQGWGSGGLSSCEVGEAFMRVRAAENNVYFIVAKNMFNEGGRSMILDNGGNIIAESSKQEEQVLIAAITPEFDMIDNYHYDNYYGNVESTKARFLLARSPSLYMGVINENPPVMERYKNLRLCDTQDQATEIIQKFLNLDEETKKKYHW